MAEFVSTCPHCHTEKVAFSSYGDKEVIQNEKILYWNTFFVCRKCEKGIVVEFSESSHIAPTPHSYRGDPQDCGYSVRAIYPAPQNIEAPYALPDGIANDYIEAEKNLQRRNFTSAGMMFRRVLERATKHLAPDEKGKRLKDRIALLAEQHRITPEVLELAECLRDDGTVAAYEEEAFTELGAHQMRDFTHLFLMYTFALPQFVDDARAKGEQPK